MGLFDSIGSIFNPSNFMGSEGNSLLDLMDPGNTFHTGASQRAADRQFQLEYDIANKNFEEAKAQNSWNRNMQEQAFQYQKDLNSLQMEREDTAVARRVADLKASGLSPTLAAGSAAAAAPMHAGSIAPVSPAQKMTPSDVKVQAAMFKESMMKDRMQLASSLMGNIANVAKTSAEIQLLKAQTNQLNTITPLDLKLKSQLLEFNDEFNPWRIADTISSIENRKADTYYKERQRFLVDSQIVLNNDEHGLNIQREAGLVLDNRLKGIKISLDNQNYIKNAISIELLSQEYRQKEETYNYNKLFYNDHLGVPIGYNVTPWNSFYRFGPHDPVNPDYVPDPRPDGFKPWDKTPGSWNDFVARQFKEAGEILEKLHILGALRRVMGFSQ